MIIYLASFFLSAGFLYLGERSKSKIQYRIYVFMALLIVSLLAGLRGATVGTDVITYGIGFYNRAVNAENFVLYFKQLASYGITDFSYIILNFILARISKDYHLGLFFYSLITYSSFYFGLKRYKSRFDTPIWLGMLLFYFVQYNLSLNAMRQMMAVSMVFLASSYLFEKNYKYFFVLFILAFGFHSSGLIGIVVLGLYIVLRSGRNTSINKQIVQASFIVFGVGITFLVGPKVIRMLVSMGIFRENYLNYLSGGSYDSGAYLSGWSILPQFIYLFLALFFYGRINKRKMEPLLMSTFCVLSFLSSFGTLISVYFNRIGYYFVPFEMTYLATVSVCFSRKSKKIWAWILVLIVSIFWIHDIALMNYNETLPYVFMN